MNPWDGTAVRFFGGASKVGPKARDVAPINGRKYKGFTGGK